MITDRVIASIFVITSKVLRQNMSAHTRRALMITAVLVMAFTMSQFYRTALAVIAPNVSRDLELTPAILGLTSGTFFLTTAIMQIPCGLLLDRFGPRRLIPIMMLFAVAGTILMSIATNAVHIITGQALIGLGCSGIFVGGLVTVSRWYAPNRFSLIGTLIVAASNMGLLASGTPFAALTDAIGWRQGYLVTGMLVAAIALIYGLAVRDAPKGHPWLNRERESWGRSIKGVGMVLSEPRVYAILGVALVSYAGVIAIRGLWGGPYLAHIFDMNALERGDVLLIMSLTLTIGSVLYGALDNYGIARRKLILSGAMGLVLLFTALAFQTAPDSTTITILFCLIGVAGPYSVLLLADSRGLFSDHMTGRAITVINVANFGGAGAMQIWPGLVLGSFTPVNGHPPLDAYRLVFAIIAVLVLTALLAYWRFGPRGGNQQG